jgi:hypothetical protein
VALGGEVGGMSAATQIDFFTAATTNVDTGTLRMTIDGNGNVGVGTSSPTSKFEVNGRIRQTGSATDAGYLQTNSGLLASTTALNPGIAFYGGNGANALYGADLGYNSTVSRYRTRIFSGNVLSDVALGRQQTAETNPTQSAFLEFLTIRGDSGNVGIGTAAPDVKLQVHHSSANTNLANIGLPDLVLGLRNTSNTNGNMSIISFLDAGNYGNVHITALQKDQTNHSADLLFSTRTNTTTFGERMRITSTGNVGIGIQTPNYKLDVQGGSINTSQNLCINGDCKGSWAAVTGPWTSGSGSINYTAGTVGIGTSSPLYTLDVNGGVNGFRAKAASAAAGDTIATFENNSAIKMIVRANGNVGIGTTSPAKTLDVNGDINAVGTITGGTIQAKYQDVAEWVDSSQPLAAGTVVVLDPDKNNQVVASTQSYDSRVAGVISPQPGITLGERGEGRVLVAASGRVRVKVDAGNGPIKIGDLLVTSDKEGFAMKSVPVEFGGVRMHRPGTLIGKALEPLAQGTGEILVLLSLQ